MIWNDYTSVPTMPGEEEQFELVQGNEKTDNNGCVYYKHSRVSHKKPQLQVQGSQQLMQNELINGKIS